MSSTTAVFWARWNGDTTHFLGAAGRTCASFYGTPLGPTDGLVNKTSHYRLDFCSHALVWSILTPRFERQTLLAPGYVQSYQAEMNNT
jgi:hypothetical protein